MFIKNKTVMQTGEFSGGGGGKVGRCPTPDFEGQKEVNKKE